MNSSLRNACIDAALAWRTRRTRRMWLHSLPWCSASRVTAHALQSIFRNTDLEAISWKQMPRPDTRCMKMVRSTLQRSKALANNLKRQACDIHLCQCHIRLIGMPLPSHLFKRHGLSSLSFPCFEPLMNTSPHFAATISALYNIPVCLRYILSSYGKLQHVRPSFWLSVAEASQSTTTLSPGALHQHGHTQPPCKHYRHHSYGLQMGIMLGYC